MMLLFAAALALAAAQQTDTTFAVPAAGRLNLEVFTGTAVVRAWDRQQVRVQATHDERVRVRVSQRGGTVGVEAHGRWGPPGSVRYDVMVPRGYGVAIDGLNVVATVDGVHGRVNVENVEGSITIRNVVGDVTVESVSGRVLVEDVRGRVTAGSANQDLRIVRVTGDITAETANGSVIIEGADAAAVNVSTISGVIRYDGTVRQGGRYTLHAHNGAITMSIPGSASATVHVSTRNGTIQSEFPVSLRGGADNRVSFTMGGGSARIELETFNGSVNLVRPRGR
jgi:hypothetical protein